MRFIKEDRYELIGNAFIQGICVACLFNFVKSNIVNMFKAISTWISGGMISSNLTISFIFSLKDIICLILLIVCIFRIKYLIRKIRITKVVTTVENEEIEENSENLS